jgi:hypothetical protein
VGAWTRREKVFGNFIVFLSFQATETLYNINTLRRTKLIVFDILDSIHFVATRPTTPFIYKCILWNYSKAIVLKNMSVKKNLSFCAYFESYFEA